eukprot:SAG31_NODE_33422_length_344_cov_0.628571_1_plen_20_part_01
MPTRAAVPLEWHLIHAQRHR